MTHFSKRIRNIPLKEISSAGSYITRKNCNSKEIQFESSLEMDFIYLLEFDIEVEYYTEQPLAIKYLDNENKERLYYPDFYIHYFDANKKDNIIEVKYFNDLKKNEKELGRKFNAARDFCKLHSLDFIIITEREIRKERDYLRNIKFLSRFRFNIASANDSSKEDVLVGLLIIKTIRNSKTMSIESLIKELKKENIRPEQSQYYLWILIANNFVRCDLTKKLKMKSIVWVE